LNFAGGLALRDKVCLEEVDAMSLMGKDTQNTAAPTRCNVRPLYLPMPAQDSLEAGRLILRDGSMAALRPAQPGDCEALMAFFRHLSPASRYQRFASAALPTEGLVARFCETSRPQQSMCLIVTRTVDAGPAIIATGSYHAETADSAEVALAVADAFHGKGLGTLLLERLALLAARHGIRRFWAVTQADNQPMLDVFRESGLELGESMRAGSMEVDLSLVPSEESVSRTEARDRIATAASLRPFFRPNAVAVVGASRDPASIGHRVLAGLLASRFAGTIYPVNPRAGVIAGLTAYPTVRDIPEPVDLAVIAVPQPGVGGVVEDCAARGVRALVIITAGFAEVGAEGRDFQRRLVEQVRGHGMRMIGPNCMGIINADPAVRLNGSFAPLFPPPGRVAMSSQSGALGLAVLAAAAQRHLGLSTFVSVGNKADVSGNDLLQYWEEDPGTDVILLYLESFGNPRRFARIARRVSRRKPIVAVKSGRTQAGSRAAGSHTAALAASDTAVEALFHQTGVIRADTLEEMFDLASALGSQPLPRGRRVAVVTNAGGPGILCADACEAGGLVLPELPAEVRARLAAYLPSAAGLGNPVDMIASAGPAQFRQVIETLLCCDAIDALIAIYVPVGLAETAAVCAAIAEGVSVARAGTGAGKPALACMVPAPEDLASVATAGIPVFGFPEPAARVLAKLAAYAEWRAQPLGLLLEYDNTDPSAARTICQRALTERGSGWLSPPEAAQVFAAMRVPTVPAIMARTADDAAAAATTLGFPVAVKLASLTLVHKTEVGGVRLGLANEAQVREAFLDIARRVTEKGDAAAMDGVLVQPMQSGGVEIMVGMIQDPLFGPLLAFGLGGIHVEILGDVCFRVTPLTDNDAREMVRSIRGYRLLQGYRGHAPADIPALEELLLRVSRLVEAVPEIAELDLNPVFALSPGNGCQVGDARIRVDRALSK